MYKSDVAQITKLSIIPYDGPINSISGIENLVNLQRLGMEGSVSVLNGLTKLYGLDLINNQVSDISALKTLTNLQSINLSNNPISDTDMQSLMEALPKC